MQHGLQRPVMWLATMVNWVADIGFKGTLEIGKEGLYSGACGNCI